MKTSGMMWLIASAAMWIACSKPAEPDEAAQAKVQDAQASSSEKVAESPAEAPEGVLWGIDDLWTMDPTKGTPPLFAPQPMRTFDKTAEQVESAEARALLDRTVPLDQPVTRAALKSLFAAENSATAVEYEAWLLARSRCERSKDASHLKHCDIDNSGKLRSVLGSHAVSVETMAQLHQKLLEHPDELVRSAVIEAMLYEATASSDAAVRQTGVVAALQAVESDPSTLVWVHAIDDSAFAPQLWAYRYWVMRLLDDPREPVRRAAASHDWSMVLDQREAKFFRMMYIKHLDDPDTKMAVLSAFRLGELPDPKAIEPLSKLLKGDRIALHEPAVKGLMQLWMANVLGRAAAEVALSQYFMNPVMTKDHPTARSPLGVPSRAYFEAHDPKGEIRLKVANWMARLSAAGDTEKKLRRNAFQKLLELGEHDLIEQTMPKISKLKDSAIMEDYQAYLQKQ